MDTILRTEGLSKKYILKQALKKKSVENFWVLKDISFSLGKGQIIGFIGRNGAGKTTLLNLLAGVLQPTSGEIKVSGKVMGLFNLGAGFQDELSGDENIYLNGSVLGAKRSQIKEVFTKIVRFSELGDFIYRPLGTYSQGMRLRLAFSIIVHLNWDVLVIDEVLGVGDPKFFNKCMERLLYLKSNGKSFIITTQDMGLIRRFCDYVYVLENGKMMTSGDATEATTYYDKLLGERPFYVGPRYERDALQVETKWWSDDKETWGEKIGSKEIEVISVEFLNAKGIPTQKIKVHDALQVHVAFRVNQEQLTCHFGVAIFREDGLYCYGTNTKNDQKTIPRLDKGKNYFLLEIDSVPLNKGRYYVSIAVWDEEEYMAYDYHNAVYTLDIVGEGLVKESFLSFDWSRHRNPINFFSKKDSLPKVDGAGFIAQEKELVENSDFPIIKYAEMVPVGGMPAEFFRTNQAIKLQIELADKPTETKDLSFWVGVFRDDGILCDAIGTVVQKKLFYQFELKELPLLAGKYFLRVGVWSDLQKKWCVILPNIFSFSVVSDNQDHGTIYMRHKWKFSF